MNTEYSNTLLRLYNVTIDAYPLSLSGSKVDKLELQRVELSTVSFSPWKTVLSVGLFELLAVLVHGLAVGQNIDIIHESGWIDMYCCF
jgi:hypothetical protein